MNETGVKFGEDKGEIYSGGDCGGEVKFGLLMLLLLFVEVEKLFENLNAFGEQACETGEFGIEVNLETSSFSTAADSFAAIAKRALNLLKAGADDDELLDSFFIEAVIKVFFSLILEVVVFLVDFVIFEDFLFEFVDFFFKDSSVG